jgi:5-methylcytosine-specific restriction endonuclease McrA
MEPSFLNLDHVLPRSQGGRSGWENIVTSCYPCNQRKAGRTPEQAAMRLLKRPVRPAKLAKPRLTTLRAAKALPTEWEPYWR